MLKTQTMRFERYNMGAKRWGGITKVINSYEGVTPPSKAINNDRSLIVFMGHPGYCVTAMFAWFENMCLMLELI